MSDTLATEKIECPCCKGAKILAVYDCDGYTQIGNVACCYCVATGYINTEPQSEKTVTEIFAKAGPTIADTRPLATRIGFALDDAYEREYKRGLADGRQADAGKPAFTLAEKDAAFRSGYATAVREFRVNEGTHPIIAQIITQDDLDKAYTQGLVKASDEIYARGYAEGEAAAEEGKRAPARKRSRKAKSVPRAKSRRTKR